MSEVTYIIQGHFPELTHMAYPPICEFGKSSLTVMSEEKKNG